MNKISPFMRRCLFLLLFALVVTSDSTAQEFGPRIVFASNRDGNWDIYSMDVNGDNLLQLTDHPASDKYPACSPDGRRIAFTSDRGVTDDLYVMDSDGKNVVRLTHDDFFETGASWSPDGTKIAFASFRIVVGNTEIYVMDRDGNNAMNLTKHKWHDVRPSWSPDGSKMAFVSFRDGGFNTPHHIFVMNADGTGRRNLTADTILRFNSAPTWSPDGHRIAFNSLRHFFPAPSRNDVFVITADGKELEQLTDGPSSSRSPVYSPDGTKIAYVSRRGGDSNVILMDANGNNRVKLTKTAPGIDNEDPSWLHGGLAVNPNAKLPVSWGLLKRRDNSW
ncbi:MAG: DPP IV N-terminal domain-containing protein [Candidatus Poribacteria bacterium]|nr:DPP IV N-terminal domain-containing protein [Candidatus Poribacteria bacterium]